MEAVTLRSCESNNRPLGFLDHYNQEPIQSCLEKYTSTQGHNHCHRHNHLHKPHTVIRKSTVQHTAKLDHPKVGMHGPAGPENSSQHQTLPTHYNRGFVPVHSDGNNSNPVRNSNLRHSRLHKHHNSQLTCIHQCISIPVLKKAPVLS